MTWEFLFSYPIILPFHTVHGVLKARILKWLAIPFSSGAHSVRPLHHDLPGLGCPAPWLAFIELGKAVVLVWLDWLVFCEYGFNVSALWCPLATPTILLGFLLPWVWGISSRLLQQGTATAPYLGRGVSPYRRRSWPSVSNLRISNLVSFFATCISSLSNDLNTELYYQKTLHPWRPMEDRNHCSRS